MSIIFLRDKSYICAFSFSTIIGRTKAIFARGRIWAAVFMLLWRRVNIAMRRRFPRSGAGDVPACGICACARLQRAKRCAVFFVRRLERDFCRAKKVLSFRANLRCCGRRFGGLSPRVLIPARGVRGACGKPLPKRD
ncbi:MAG: hypothetical protein DBX55_00270 [Verrucomicrobia bacterium]|nr:MAG: hypothetical protein DBX55_00270 [Verrucomicrobiota bacterium]